MKKLNTLYPCIQQTAKNKYNKAFTGIQIICKADSTSYSEFFWSNYGLLK